MLNKDVLFAGAALCGRSGHVVGRELLARLYREKTGLPCPEILVTPRGKPYFPNSSLHFSISHTKSHAFCALAEHPIGMDAEEKDRHVHLKLAEKILSPAEYARFEAATDQRLALLKLWVLKEAAAKLSGEGLNGYPNHTDFSPDDPRIWEQDGCIIAILTNEGESYVI